MQPERRSALHGARAAAAPNRRRVYGTAGASVADADTEWASNRQVVRHGQLGEERTAAALERGLGDDVVIMHDLHIPIPGFKANIDHVVIAGRTVTIVDAKSWAGGFYWTTGDRTRRGMARFEPAEKQTMRLATKTIGGYLTKRDIEAVIAEPIVAVWSTSGRATLWAAKFPGAKLVNGERLRSRAERLFGNDYASDDIVEALASLVR